MSEPPLGPTTERVAEAMGHYLVGDTTVGEALHLMCAAALDALPAARHVGISTTVHRQLGTFVFTHPDVERIDGPQYANGDGPCVEAFMVGIAVRIDDTAKDGPFAEFRASARQHGIRSVLSEPMLAGPQIAGALNFYATVPSAFDPASTAIAAQFASHAAYLLINHQSYWDAKTLGENLRQAMDTRAVIEQAKGIIMATTGLGPDEAFVRLQEQSQHENVKLRDLAEELVARTQRQRPDA